jgi:DAACS family dicarboxylate/amino acid:cation (Na+ or H+) symporter
MTSDKKMALHWKIIIALVLGGLAGSLAYKGVLGGLTGTFETVVVMVADLFTRLLKMAVIPLVVSSLIVGISNIAGMRDMGRIGLKTAGFYMLTTVTACFTGLIVVNVMRPGVGVDLKLGETAKSGLTTPDSMWEIIVRMVPTNIFKAMSESDMLAIIFFTILFAVFTGRVANEHRDRIVGFFDSVFQVMMGITHAIINLAPYGVFALVAKLILKTGFDAFRPLAWYVLAVAVALGLHFFLSLPLYAKFIGKVRPYKLMKAMSPALLTAFSTASSAATLPLTMDCSETRAGVKNKIASFVLPTGATVNMDGTALYEVVAVLFIAQVLGYDLSFTQQLIVAFTAILVSVGAAGIPHAGLVMMVIILQAVGLPLEATGMIWAVDRVLDMARTACNVWGDSVATAVVANTEGDMNTALLES